MIPTHCTVYREQGKTGYVCTGSLLEVTPPGVEPAMALIAENEWSAQSNDRQQVRWVPLAVVITNPDFPFELATRLLEVRKAMRKAMRRTAV